jgi:hypothetical protein
MSDGLDAAGLNDMFRTSAAAQNGGVTPLPAEAFHVNDADVAWVNRLCVNLPIATFEQRVRFGGGIDKLSGRKVYISASKFADGPFGQFYARFSEDPAWRTYSIPSDHGLMLDEPERLTEILEEVST